MFVPTAPLIGVTVDRPTGCGWTRGTIVGLASTITDAGAGIPCVVVRSVLAGAHTIDRVLHPATLAVVGGDR